MYELAPQANQLASKGRYGDSMLVHMNPAEVGIMNAMSGDKMTINPDTGQPEAFAFLLPLLGGLAGSALGGAGMLGGLGALSAGAIGTGLGKFAETGSLKQALLSGAMSYGIGSLAKGAMGTFADKAAEAGTTGFTPLAEAADLPMFGSNLGDFGKTVGDTFVSNTAQDALTTGFNEANPIFSKLVANPFEKALGQTGAGIGSAVAPGLQSLAGSLGTTAVFPEYPEFNDNREIYDIPEAAPPTRRLRSMPSDFAQNNRGEFRFFEDPAREKIGESARNFFPEGSTADRETKYAQYGGPVRMNLGGKIEPVTAGNAPKSFGGMMGQFDPQEVYDRGGKLPGIMGNFFGVSDLGKFSGLSDEEMLLLKEKKKARRMQEGGVLEEGIGSIPTDMVPSESVMDDDSMRSEVALEDSANVFNEGVQAIMCESAAPKEALTRFVEMYGMDRLHEVICEVISIAQEGDDMEGTLTKENEDGTPVALKEGGSVDTIPASLEGKQSYLLAENEYIIPEPVVRAVGGGNVDAGADAFDRFIQNVKAVA